MNLVQAQRLVLPVVATFVIGSCSPINHALAVNPIGGKPDDAQYVCHEVICTPEPAPAAVLTKPG